MRVQLALLGLVLLAGACRSTKPAVLEQGAVLEDGARLKIDFQGARRYSSRRLAEVIEEDLVGLERRRSVRAAIDDAAYSLELFYRSEGFPACTVRYETDPVSGGVLRARLIVEEGPRVSIARVRFEGVEAFGESDLASFILPPRRWGVLPRRRVWFSAGRLESSLEAIEAYYRSEGLLDASVELVSPHPREGPWKEQVTVRLRVEEGQRYTLRQLEIRGGVPRIDARLHAADLSRERVHPRLASTFRSRLSELYARAGYPDARITAEQQAHAEQGVVDIRLEVSPGPRVTLGDVIIDGDPRTHRGRILGALTLRPGDRYDVRKQRASFRNLYSLGVFSSVGLSLEPPPGPGTEAEAEATAPEEPEAPGERAPGPAREEVRDLHVRLEEGPSREFFIEPGYGSYEGPRLRFGVEERNVFGTGRSVRAETTVGPLAQNATVGVLDPLLVTRDGRIPVVALHAVAVFTHATRCQRACLVGVGVHP
jgi:outer membrane protein insertion porin family